MHVAPSERGPLVAPRIRPPPSEISRRAKQIYARAKSKLAVERGHGIPGIHGNDRALACLCLCLVKLSNLSSPSERKDIEITLQRTSGVTQRIFTGGLKDLARILETSGHNSNSGKKKKPTTACAGASTSGPSKEGGSPSKKKKKKEKTAAENGQQEKYTGQVGDDEVQQQEKLASDTRTSLLLPASAAAARTPHKRPISAILEEEEEQADDDDDDDDDDAATPKRKTAGRGGPLSPELRLPAHPTIPPKPMSIFHSVPVFHPNKNMTTSSRMSVNFSDWNWKLDLCNDQWSPTDVREWFAWNQTCLDKSLS
ncbi:hypothetical protein PCANC_18547 [Puccinia coronata f. sp. avenae]|uniref:Uncharacterized protein n=1 Tax=Puccinia coronata f. sp. avenae TaxID=200324 RepID=A0A2N5SB47_9BASI|nr:hypothetical protein PCANC_18547 [Puccinia coronata f. sp. avenae]